MEEVLVIPKSCLQEQFKETKIYDVSEEFILDIIKKHGLFLKREIAEISYDYYQIIPYIVIRSKNKFFCTKRTKKQSEARLHEKRSIGVGGHLNPEDGDFSVIVKQGLMRELTEELFPFDYQKNFFLGVLVDFSTDVSLVHLGIVYLLETTDEVFVKETNKMSGEWMDKEQLEEPIIYNQLETWSQIVFLKLKRTKNLF
ncbi:MAG: DNA mismatch repair protein MutT [Bacilli bacterium]